MLIKMNILVAMLALAASILAEPTHQSYFYRVPGAVYRYPYVTGYSPLLHAPLVYRRTFPTVTPISPLPYTVPEPLVGLKSQYHNQDLYGQANYGHYEPGQSHTAIQDAYGNKLGSFSYVNTEGKLIQTNYIADALGYRVSSNNLPVAPVDISVPPSPPAETPEVLAARTAHLTEVEKVKGRSKRDAPIVPAGTSHFAYSNEGLSHVYRFGGFPDFYRYPYIFPYPHAYPTTNSVPEVTKDGYLKDIPEVELAKSHHFAQVAPVKAYLSYPYVLRHF